MTEQDNSKHTQEAGEAEAWFKDLVEHARDLVQCVDSKGRFVYVNQAWLTTLNYTHEEMNNITLWDIIHPDSMEHCMAVFQQVLTGKAYGAVEAIFVAKDGTPVLVEGNVNVKLDEDGHFVHTRGIFRDVTERKQVESSLLEIEAERKALLDAIPDLMFLFKKDGYFIDCKVGNHNQLLFKPDEFINKHVSEVLPPYLAELTIARLSRIFESGETQVYEYPLEIKGEQKIFESRLVSCGDDRALSIVRDITDRKNAEEELQRFKKAVEQSMAGVAMSDMSGNIFFINNAWADMHGYSIEEVIGCHLSIFHTHEQMENEVIPSMKRLLKDDSFHSERGHLRKDGTTFTTHMASTVVKGADGEPFGMIAIISDISDRKRAEMALTESEEKHRRLFETMAQGIIYQAADGRIISVNPAAEKILGLSFEQMRGITSLDPRWQMIEEDGTIVAGTDHPTMIALRTGKTVGPVTRGVFHQDKNSYVWLSITAIPLFQPDKKAPFQAYATFVDITERREAVERIRYLSFHDQLTGLYNRHFLEEEMQRFDTERQLPISIIMADLNGLKLINDTYGHQIGDEVLKKAASILKNTCRDDDLIARFGGDEFVLYLPRTGEKEALKISSRIEKACLNEQIKDMPLSLSTGTAVKLNTGQKLADVLKQAENNMYQNKLTESRSGKSAIVSTILQTLAAKSFETEAHTRNMQEAAYKIGEKVGLPNSELHRLQLLITLHDIGKINIPEELLNKQETLTDAEWKIVKKHCEIGFRIAKATDNFAHVAEDILAHHERWDGSGYPQGLKGEAIPLLARITAIADAYEVMSHGRPYKKAMSRSEIVVEFKKCSGTHFDPQLVEIFLAILETDG